MDSITKISYKFNLNVERDSDPRQMITNDRCKYCGGKEQVYAKVCVFCEEKAL